MEVNGLHHSIRVQPQPVCKRQTAHRGHFANPGDGWLLHCRVANKRAEKEVAPLLSVSSVLQVHGGDGETVSFTVYQQLCLHQHITIACCQQLREA